MKKNVIALTISTFIALCAIFFLIVNLLVVDKRNSLITFTNNSAKIAVLQHVAQINKAIENSDDLELIDIVASIAKIENISSSFIVDQNNKTLVRSNLTAAQPATNEGETIYNIPLVKNGTLFYTISWEQTSSTVNKWQIRYYTLASLAVLLITFIFYAFAKFFIMRSYGRMKEALENNNSNNNDYNEITDIVETENEKTKALINELSKNNKSLTDIANYFMNSKNENIETFIILNSKNDIINAFDKTGEFLKEGFSNGSNILEAVKNKVLLEILNNACNSANCESESVYKDFFITTLAIETDKQLSATVIKIGRR